MPKITEEKRKYDKIYRAKNREKIRIRMQRYNIETKESRRPKRKKYILENYEKVRKRDNISHGSRYEIRREEIKEKKRIKRIEVMAIYGNGTPRCNCCGIKGFPFLTFDHIDGTGGKHRKNNKSDIVNWIIKNNYPDSIQVLCMNCNFAKGDGIECAHKTGNLIRYEKPRNRKYSKRN